MRTLFSTLASSIGAGKSYARGATLCGVLVLLGIAHAESPADVSPLSAKALEQFDRKWEKLSKREPNLTSRETYQFLLNATAHNWRPEKWEAVIDLAEAMHDRDPASNTYGNYRWYWHETKPDDRNAVEFCLQLTSLTWTLYQDRFPAAAKQKLLAALELGAEGAVRQKVVVSYTNIFLMRLANCIIVGEQLGRPDLLQKGRAWLNEWLEYTRGHGIHEYSSPTYYAVDLEDLGILARYAHDPRIRAEATQGLDLLWTDIAANWFEPHGGIGGAHSRDYDFLTGHGELDRHLVIEHWIPGDLGDETRQMLTELSHVGPAPELLQKMPSPPRIVSQSWGEKPWERSTHYVGHHFSLGSAETSYHAQDKVLALALIGGPKRPLVNFSLDYRSDPYGEAKVMTSGSHPKLTHLIPFVSSVQRGAEVLLVASVDPATTLNPAGKNQPMTYADVDANVVLPSNVELWQDGAKLSSEAASLAVKADRPLYLHDGDVAIALWFAATHDEHGKTAEVRVINDGAKVHASRLTAHLASGKPAARVTVALWVRAAEKLDEPGFARFASECDSAARQAKVTWTERALDVAVKGVAPLRVHVDLAAEKRLAVEGADPELERGILNVNGRDFGAEIIRQ